MSDENIILQNNFTFSSGLVYEIYNYKRFENEIEKLRMRYFNNINIMIKRNEVIKHEKIYDFNLFKKENKNSWEIEVDQMHKIITDKLNYLCKQVQDQQNENKQENNHPFAIVKNAVISYTKIQQINKEKQILWKIN